MEDEFLHYLYQKIGDNLIASYDNTDLLLYGMRKNGGVAPLGLMITIGVNDIDENEYQKNSRTRARAQTC